MSTRQTGVCTMINVKTFAVALLVMKHLAAQRTQQQSEDPPMNETDPNATVPSAESIAPPADPTQPLAPAPDATAADPAPVQSPVPQDQPAQDQPTPAAATPDSTPQPQADATPAPIGGGASDNPFLETAKAAAKLIELLRADPQALHFLEALLVCLKPSTDDSPKS